MALKGISIHRPSGKGLASLTVDWRRFAKWIAVTNAASWMGASRSTKKIGKKLYGKIKEKTPVLTGKAKAGWLMDFKGLKNKIKPTMIIYNDVKYIVVLEFGSSRKAPYGMVRVSMRELMGDGANTIAKSITKENANLRVSFATMNASRGMGFSY